MTGNKTTYTQVGDAFAAHIQPLGDKYGQADMGRTGKTFRMFTLTEVRIGDRITDQTTTKYECYGLAKQKFRGKTHYEALLRSA
ncbi:hypothetical protein [Novosphingobium aquae]|uniref:Uncharacterized protein n=1 Tax=Novosphingobium aquae TaxID=3133435 RepID=A0ABU8SC08_9SPHN